MPNERKLRIDLEYIQKFELAIEEGSPAPVLSLLLDGVDPNIRLGVKGNPALHLAIDYFAELSKEERMSTVGIARRDIVKFIFLAASPLVDLIDFEKFTPLLDAVSEGNEEAVRILIEHGADVNYKADGGTILFGAIFRNHPSVVKLLLDSGARVDTRLGDKEKTYLSHMHLAALYGRTEVI